MLKSVTDLAGEIAERADEIERERKLPEDLARKLKLLDLYSEIKNVVLTYWKIKKRLYVFKLRFGLYSF